MKLSLLNGGKTASYFLKEMKKYLFERTVAEPLKNIYRTPAA
jgi:hypothetical protein